MPLWKFIGINHCSSKYLLAILCLKFWNKPVWRDIKYNKLVIELTWRNKWRNERMNSMCLLKLHFDDSTEKESDVYFLVLSHTAFYQATYCWIETEDHNSSRIDHKPDDLKIKNLQCEWLNSPKIFLINVLTIQFFLLRHAMISFHSNCYFQKYKKNYRSYCHTGGIIVN